MRSFLATALMLVIFLSLIPGRYSVNQGDASADTGMTGITKAFVDPANVTA